MNGEYFVALYGHEEILENFLLRYRCSDFEIISQKCFLLSTLFTHFHLLTTYHVIPLFQNNGNVTHFQHDNATSRTAKDTIISLGRITLHLVMTGLPKAVI